MEAGTTKSHEKHDGTLKLLMYRSMLASDKDWLAGYEAAKSNAPLENNPFDTNAEEYKCWERGWWDGFYGEDYTASELTDELEVWLITSKTKNRGSQTQQNITKREQKENKVNIKKILYLLAVILITTLGINILLNV